MDSVYVLLVGGIPTPIAISSDDCYDAQWSYCPGTGAIRYLADWVSGVFLGRWCMEMRPDEGGLMAFRYGMEFEVPLLGPDRFLTPWTPWGYGECVGAGMDIVVEVSYSALGPGWTFASLFGAQGELYQEIKDNGNDQNDTAPRTWTDTDDPW